METIEGVVSRIVFRNNENGYSVISLEDSSGDELVAVGIMPLAGEGEHVELVGERVYHRIYGDQFKVSSCKVLTPSSLKAIQTYLESGLIKGVGPKNAKLLVDTFGTDTLEIIEKEPSRLCEVPGIGKKRAGEIAESYREKIELKTTIMALQELDISTSQAMKLYSLYGSMAVSLIHENPYRLIDEVESIGFKTADKIACSAGLSFDSSFRVQAGISYVLSLARREGHTFLPRDLLISTTARLLGVEESAADNELSVLTAKKLLINANVGEVNAVFSPSLYYQESACASMLRMIIDCKADAPLLNIESEIAQMECEREITLAPMQKEAVITAMTSGALVITGGPGTGKTTILEFIIGILDKLDQTYELSAPTGRAAKRMTEATGSEARTIHRMLEYSFSENGFMRDEEMPLEADVIIVDEMSMVDVPLMYSLLKAIAPGTRLIMVGDADQLPPVGAGNVLRDIIRSKVVPTIRLNDIFRQSGRSMIVKNAHRINRGEMPELLSEDSDFLFEENDYANDCLARIRGIVTGKVKLVGAIDPINDIQVLAPMKKGVLGVNNINAVLQEAVNPKSPDKAERIFGDTVFRVGDKVMQIKNNYSLEWTATDENGLTECGLGVFNGDIGTIMAIDNDCHTLQILFDDNRVVEYEGQNLEELALAYCISIHKSQGNEFPIVVLPLLTGPVQLFNRNLLYTAITRARVQVCILGHRDTVIRMVQNTEVKRRYSALARMLINAGAPLEVYDS